MVLGSRCEETRRGSPQLVVPQAVGYLGGHTEQLGRGPDSGLGWKVQPAQEVVAAEEEPCQHVDHSWDSRCDWAAMAADDVVEVVIAQVVASAVVVGGKD
jgi:hypothetical protein